MDIKHSDGEICLQRIMFLSKSRRHLPRGEHVQGNMSRGTWLWPQSVNDVTPVQIDYAGGQHQVTWCSERKYFYWILGRFLASVSSLCSYIASVMFSKSIARNIHNHHRMAAATWLSLATTKNEQSRMSTCFSCKPSELITKIPATWHLLRRNLQMWSYASKHASNK